MGVKQLPKPTINPTKENRKVCAVLFLAFTKPLILIWRGLGKYVS